MPLAKFLRLMARAKKFGKGILDAAEPAYVRFKRQVSLKLEEDGTLARFDAIGENADGSFTIVEAKMGGGRLTRNQRKVLEALQAGEKIKAVGANAGEVFGQDKIGKSVTGDLSRNMQLNDSMESVGDVLKKR